VSARRDIGDEVNASLLLVDPTTGDVRSRRHLAVFTGVRIEDLTARATLADERLLITLGGGVFCTDISGRPLWVRRQTWLSPTPEAAGPDPAWQGRVHRPPIVQGGRVLATQPGVWGIECLDVRTGRLLWQKPLPNLAAALAATEKTALVRTTGGVLALEPGDGRVAWRHDAPAAQWVMPRPVGNRLLLVRPAEVGDGREADELPRLVALAVESGNALGSWPLAGPVADYRLIGPGMIFDGALLLAAAEEETPTARTVFRLSTDREAADEDEGASQE
jgi:outer membrane protein assembly factor BamB